MSSTSANLAFMTKISQFISAKLENVKSVKDSMTDQQQNSDNIIDSFDMSNQFSEASSSEAFKLPAFYQCLNCSHMNMRKNLVKT